MVCLWEKKKFLINILVSVNALLIDEIKFQIERSLFILNAFWNKNVMGFERITCEFKFILRFRNSVIWDKNHLREKNAIIFWGFDDCISFETLSSAYNFKFFISLVMVLTTNKWSVVVLGTFGYFFMRERLKVLPKRHCQTSQTKMSTTKDDKSFLSSVLHIFKCLLTSMWVYWFDNGIISFFAASMQQSLFIFTCIRWMNKAMHARNRV